MSLFWIVAKHAGEASVFLQEASTLLHARIKAGMAGHEGEFVEAHQLDAKLARKVPKGMTGRPLSLKEAQELVEMLG